MPDEIRYAILKAPMLAQNLAASRTPRLQPSVAAEVNQMVSAEVARGEWTVDAANGEPLHTTGQTVAERLEFMLSTRPHWLMPKAITEPADDVWTSGNLTKQGERYKHFLDYCNGSKAAADVMWREEAARYSTVPGSTTPGIKPGEKRDSKKTDEANASSNPWSAKFRGDETARAAKIASIIKQGTKLADALAKAAGTTVSKPLYK